MANGGNAGAAKLRLREFDGESEDPQLWLRHVERVSDANQWSEAVRLRQAEASLVGAAELWFETIPGDGYESWGDFRDAVRTRFREDHFSERLEEELRGIK